jgi:hypothetical protein
MSENQATAEIPPTAEETPKAPASGTSTQDKTQTGSGEVTVNSPDDWHNVTKQLLAPTEPVAPEGETASEVIEEQPVATETPAVTEQAAPAAVEPEVEIEEEETPEEPKKSAQVRIRPTTALDKMAMSIMKGAEAAGQPVDMPTALAEARRILKVEEAPAPADAKTEPASQPVSPTPADDGLPQTPSEVDAKIAELRQQRKQAKLDLNVDEDDRLTIEIESLIERKRSLQDGERQAQEQNRQAESRRFKDTLEASKAKAVELYPDCAVADSPLVKEALRIDEELKRTNNPLYKSADKPLKIIQMAANNLDIAPGAKPAAKKPVTSPQPVKSRPVQPAVPIATGAARTTQANPNGQLEDALNKVNTPEDYETFLNSTRRR